MRRFLRSSTVRPGKKKRRKSISLEEALVCNKESGKKGNVKKSRTELPGDGKRKRPRAGK